MAALLNKLTLGAIVSFLRFVSIIRFSFNSRGIGPVLFSYEVGYYLGLPR